MPFYEYACFNGHLVAEMRRVKNRKKPLQCKRCDGKMKLVLSPVAGVVRDPAAGPRKTK